MKKEREYDDGPNDPELKRELENQKKYGVGPRPRKPKYTSDAKKAFDIALDGMLEKFADCPICQGEPEYCPTPQMGYQRCPTRRSAIKHMRRGKEPRIRRM